MLECDVLIVICEPVSERATFKPLTNDATSIFSAPRLHPVPAEASDLSDDFKKKDEGPRRRVGLTSLVPASGEVVKVASMTSAVLVFSLSCHRHNAAFAFKKTGVTRYDVRGLTDTGA